MTKDKCTYPNVGLRALGIAAAVWLLLGAWPCAYAVSAKVALIHSNPELGNVSSNLSEMEALVQQAFAHGAKIVVTPELATTGFSITRQQVIDDLGFESPYSELNSIRDLAIANSGYVFIAIAEVVNSGTAVYNTLVIYGPSGFIGTQQKRGLSGWHDRGELPFDVLTTPYGDIGYTICSDSYLPDWLRIMSRQGADLIILPANWWGTGQDEIWQVRARENGIWFLTANRWGIEVDTRFGFPFTYYMNDAPSAAITPDGTIRLIHRADDDAVPTNKILYYTVDVPQYRIGTALNPVYTVNFRKPNAYSEITNPYYRPDLGNQPAPGLPATGITNAATFAYTPSASESTNLATVQNLYSQAPVQPKIVVLPGLGISAQPITAGAAWYASGTWASLQEFVNTKGIQLLATSVLENLGNNHFRESLVVMRAQHTPLLRGQIHDSLTGIGTGVAPAPIDLANARVGVLLGRDALFPELSTHLAKSGIDILLVTSRVGAPTTSHDVNAPNYFWEIDMLRKNWRTATNHIFHLVASDWTGNGTVIENLGGIIGREEPADASGPVKVLDLDSALVRTKFLNAYYSFDLVSLLSP